MTTSSSKTWNIILWILQGLFGAMFLMAGGMKTFQPLEQLATTLPWVTEYPVLLVRFIGISEVAGGLGLILPSLLRIQPKLTVFAAYGLVVVMVLAAGFHGSRGEFSGIVPNVIMGGLIAVIAWGRSQKAVISAKN